MARYLVTGANGGMGRAICRLLSDYGDEPVGIDLAPADEGTPWTVIPADLTDAASLEAAIRTVGEGGLLDGVIHAAGLYDLGSLVEMDEGRFVRIFNVNLFGAYRVNRLALPYFNAGARVVIITSELAPLSPLPFTGLYAVTKAVGRVEAKKGPPEKLARVVLRAIKAKCPKPIYALNRNPLLRLLNRLPRRTQLRVIRRVLKKPKNR